MNYFPQSLGEKKKWSDRCGAMTRKYIAKSEENNL